MFIKRILPCLLAAVLLVGCSEVAPAVAPTTTSTTTATTTITTTTATTVTTTVTTTTAATTTTTTVKSTTTTNKPQAAPTKPTAATTTAPPVVLDPTYSRLLLVNAWNPLPDGFDSTVSLTAIPSKYRNGSLNQIDRDIYPYVIAMIDAARADGVKLYVRSPYRSYATQEMLFKNKVNRVIAAGTPKEEAEAKAAEAVARPGTSEHQTGLAIDFNVASSTFDNSDAFRWMVANAENYGFILRYPKDKTHITGIMYESWHWRFVGINVAKEINDLGLTFEEYCEQKSIA